MEWHTVRWMAKLEKAFNGKRLTHFFLQSPCGIQSREDFGACSMGPRSNEICPARVYSSHKAPFANKYACVSSTVVRCSASSSELVTRKRSSKLIMYSTRSRESALRSSTRDALGTTSLSSTPN